MYQPQIRQISQMIFGKEPEMIHRMTIGICNFVYRIELEDRSYIIRINEQKEWIFGTHKFLPLFKQLEIKTPTIIAEDYTKKNFPFCYQIQNRIAGQDLLEVFHDLSREELSQIAFEISTIFDKFNSLPFQKDFGGLNGAREGHEESMLNILRQDQAKFISINQEKQLLSPDVLDILNQLLIDYETYLRNVKPKLYFDDLNSKNVMIHNGRFNGLVDLDFLSKGDYLRGIGGIITMWYGSEKGEFYINEIYRYQRLTSLQRTITKVYAIIHLIGWTTEIGNNTNGNAPNEINWDKVRAYNDKIRQLYQSII